MLKTPACLVFERCFWAEETDRHVTKRQVRGAHSGGVVEFFFHGWHERLEDTSEQCHVGGLAQEPRVVGSSVVELCTAFRCARPVDRSVRDCEWISSPSCVSYGVMKQYVPSRSRSKKRCHNVADWNRHPKLTKTTGPSTDGCVGW